MKPVTVQPHHLAERIAQRGEAYRAAIMPALVETKPDGVMVFDADHPAWTAAKPPQTPPTAADEAEQERRMGICEGCDQYQGGTRWAGRFRVYRVKCRECGCGGRKVADGCPMGKF